MAVIDTSMKFPSDCWECENRINETSNDYGSWCECCRTGTKINLLLHEKPSDCPLKSTDEMIAEIEEKIHKDPWMNHTRTERDRNEAFLECLDIIHKYCDKEQKDERNN